MSLSDNMYDGEDIVFTYNPFTVDPDFCEATVTCVNVANVASSSGLTCQDLDGQDRATWNFDTQDYDDGLLPGTYTFTYEVSTVDPDDANAKLKKEFTVDVTLTDPCNANTVTTKPTPVNQEIYVNDPAVAYPL